MREFLNRVNWLPVLVLLLGVGAVVLAVVGEVEAAAVSAAVCLAWAVLAREG